MATTWWQIKMGERGRWCYLGASFKVMYAVASFRYRVPQEEASQFVSVQNILPETLLLLLMNLAHAITALRSSFALVIIYQLIPKNTEETHLDCYYFTWFCGDHIFAAISVIDGVFLSKKIMDKVLNDRWILSLTNIFWCEMNLIK